MGSYKGVLESVDFAGVPSPTTVADAAAFSERTSIPLFVFSLDVSDPANRDFSMEHHNTVQSSRAPLHLLRLHRGPRHVGHFTCITRLNAFARASSTNIHCCPHCMRQFKEQSTLDSHRASGKCVSPASENGDPQRLLPAGNTTCKFKDIRKQLPAPFVVCADSEAILRRVDIARGPKTRVYQEHTVNHVGAVLVSRYPTLLQHDYVQFDGPDCVDRFLRWLFGIEERAVQLIRRNEPMRLNRDNMSAHASATTCHICEKDLGKDKVHDHDHLTGKYRGAAHSACNLAYNYKGFRLPVFFHNLARYDGHFILQYAGKFSRHMSCIVKNAESFMSFSIGHCVFKDSLQFLLTSLGEAVGGLNAACEAGALISELFPRFERAFSSASPELRALLRQKGVFPFDWFDSAEKLSEQALPPKAAFYNKLKDEAASDADITRANDVWRLAGCHTIHDYLSLYLKTDVVLLADVFEAFRGVMHRTYGLDPAHYFMLPGYSWDAMLKTTGVIIQCLDQRLDGAYDMLDMIRRSIRGGVSMIGTRHAEANNRYLGTAEQQAQYAADEHDGSVRAKPDESCERYGWDATKPASYIMYWDANNLYGGAMSDPLPLGDFMLQQDVALDAILSLACDAPRGCFIEVDLMVPDEPAQHRREVVFTR